MPTIVLASASPRRKQLLEMLHLPVVVSPANVQEIPLPGEAPAAYVQRLARDKARAVPGALVLGADTTVVLDEHILEKPLDDDDAVRMLTMLQGRTHTVMTGICLVAGGREFSAIDRTQVTFRACPEQLLRDYVATGEPRDKAGAYAVQGRFGAFVRRVSGSVTGVIGLPLDESLGLLRRAGFPLPWESR